MIPQRKFRLSTTFLWAWCLAILLAWAGCAPEFDTEKCTTERDCFPDEVCMDGICMPDDGPVADVGPDAPEGDADPDAEDPEVVVATVVVSPESATVTVGKSIPLTAKGYDEDENLVEDAVFNWTTSDPGIATVDSDGVVTGVAAGETYVSAQWADGIAQVGSAKITVVEDSGEIASVEIVPEVETLTVGETALFEATAYTEDEEEVEDVQVIWSVEDESVATIDEDGLATAVGVGETEIIANIEGQEGRALLVVENTAPQADAGEDQTVQVGDTVNLSAEESEDLEDDFEDLEFAWEFVEDPSSGADELTDADTATPSFVPSVEGEYVVMVTVTDTDGLSDSATVTITVEEADEETYELRIEPAEKTLVAGEEFEFDIILEDSAGDPVTEGTFSWTFTNPAVAEAVDMEGKVRALAVGETSIWVNWSESGSVNPVPFEVKITVVPGDVETLTVAPEDAEIEVGQSVQLTATAKNEYGVDVTEDVDLVWSSDDTDVATVSNTGLVEGVAEGIAEIKVAVDGKEAIATILVEEADEPAPTPHTIEVEPASLDAILGDEGQLTAKVFDEDNNELADSGVTFTSDDEDIILVDPSGTWMVMDIGTTTITATSDVDSSITATVIVEVSAGEVAAISVDPAAAYPEVGATVELEATATNSNGVDITEYVTFTWNSDDEDIATVDSDGVVTGVSVGSTNIKVEAGDADMGVFIEVFPAAVVPEPKTIEILPADLAVIVIGDQAVELSAKVLDQDQNEIPGAEVKWSSNAVDTAEIDEDTGLISPNALGQVTFTATSVDETDVKASLTVEIIPGDVAGYSVAPASAQIREDEEITLELIAFNDFGIDITDHITMGAVTWSSSDTDTAEVDAANGNVKGVAPGTATITADLDGEEFTADVEVLPPLPSEFLETFDNLPLTGTNYQDDTFVGENGIEWTYHQALGFDDEHNIDGMSIILNSSRSGGSYLKSEMISGGISSLSFDYRKAYTGANNRQVEVFINDVSIGKSENIGNFSGADSTVFEFVADDLDIEGDFVLEIRAVKGNQITIDNIRWTPYNP